MPLPPSCQVSWGPFLHTHGPAPSALSLTYLSLCLVLLRWVPRATLCNGGAEGPLSSVLSPRGATLRKWTIGPDRKSRDGTIKLASAMAALKDYFFFTAPSVSRNYPGKDKGRNPEMQQAAGASRCGNSLSLRRQYREGNRLTGGA